MSHIDAEIDKYLRVARVSNDVVIVYTIERFSKDKNHQALFEGRLTIKKVNNE